MPVEGGREEEGKLGREGEREGVEVGAPPARPAVRVWWGMVMPVEGWREGGRERGGGKTGKRG